MCAAKRLVEMSETTMFRFHQEGSLCASYRSIWQYSTTSSTCVLVFHFNQLEQPVLMKLQKPGTCRDDDADPNYDYDDVCDEPPNQSTTTQ